MDTQNDGLEKANMAIVGIFLKKTWPLEGYRSPLEVAAPWRLGKFWEISALGRTARCWSMG